MGILTTYWNYVECKVDWDLDTLTKAPSTISKTRTVAKGCRGILFRSVLTEEPSFSQFLNGITLDQVRRSRAQAGQDLLYCPKPEEDKSIGVLRIVKPKGFTKVKEYTPFTVVSGTGGRPIAVTTPIERDVVAQQFDVLLESTEFVLEDAQEQMAEKFQLQETFGNFNVFFFGKRAEIFTYSGSLLNGDGSLQWRNQFLDNYEKYLRGTRCAELGARVYLLYDDVIREGFILSAGTSQNSTVDGVVKFTFSMLITGKRILGEIPPNRTDVIKVKKSAPNNEFGISEFRYKRAISDELPGVLRGYTGEFDEIRVHTANFQFAELPSFKGDEPPDDLKRAMDKKSIDALQAKQNEGQVQESGSLDTDVIWDFIDSDRLPTKTASIISGTGPLDPDNLGGVVLLQELLNGSKTVDNLKFREAIKVAEELASPKNAGRAGEAASRLGEIIAYFKDANKRLQAPAEKQDFLAKFTKENQKYVFVSPIEDELLTDLIIEGGKIKTFLASQLTTTNREVANRSTVSLAEFLASDAATLKKASASVLYAAIFSLINRPDGTPYPSIAANFADFASLGGKDNALDFVRAQELKKFESAVTGVAETLPADVAGAISAFKASTFGQLIQSRVEANLDQVEVSDDVLNQAVGYGLSPANISAMTFLSAVTTYMDAILQETADDKSKTSTDALGATASGPSPAGLKPYATKSYANLFDFGANAAKRDKSYVIYMGRGPIKQGVDGRYLRIPMGSISGGVGLGGLDAGTDASVVGTSLASFLASAFNTAIEASTGNPGGFTAANFSGAGAGIFIQKPSNPDDAQMFSSGYIKLTPEQETFLVGLGGNATVRMQLNHRMVTASAGAKRVTPSQFVKEIRLFGDSNFQAFEEDVVRPLFQKGWQIQGVAYPTALLIKGGHLPVFRTYASAGSQIEYKPSTLSEIASIAAKANLAGSSAVVGALVGSTIDAVSKIIDGSKPLPEDDDAKVRVLSEFLLTRYTVGPSAIAEISVANAALKTFGITVANYLEFVRMLESEKPAADRLDELKSSIEKAIANALGDTGQRAEDAAKSDSENKKNACVERAKA